MPSYSDGNLTAWKDWQRIVLSHSTKYGKKSFLGFKKKKSSAVDFQGSVVVSAVACRPPVHMLMSQSLIVSSYFNLLHGAGGEGAADRKRVGMRKKDETEGNEMMDEENRTGQRMLETEEWRGESWKGKIFLFFLRLLTEMIYWRKMFDKNSKEVRDGVGGRMRLLICKK